MVDASAAPVRAQHARRRSRQARAASGSLGLRSLERGASPKRGPRLRRRRLYRRSARSASAGSTSTRRLAPECQAPRVASVGVRRLNSGPLRPERSAYQAAPHPEAGRRLAYAPRQGRRAHRRTLTAIVTAEPPQAGRRAAETARRRARPRCRPCARGPPARRSLPGEAACSQRPAGGRSPAGRRSAGRAPSSVDASRSAAVAERRRPSRSPRPRGESRPG